MPLVQTKSSKLIDYDEAIDETIEILSSILVVSGVLPDDTDDFSDKTDGSLDPWASLSNNLKELMILIGKLNNLVPANSNDAICEDTVTFDRRNELLLNIENTIHKTRENMESVSTLLTRVIPAQLKRCRSLESICRRSAGLSLSVRLLPVAKSIAGAIRRQKLSWLHSFQLIEDSMRQIYTSTDNHTEVTNNIQLAYKRINRRCIQPGQNPWKESVDILEGIVADGSTDSDSKSRTNNCHDALLVDVSSTNLHSVAPGLRRFDNSKCASLQLHDIVNEFFKDNDYSRVLSILVVGSEGSGKTYLLDQIERQCSTNIEIIRPMPLIDLIGSTIGASEDALISLICYAKTLGKKCILLIDDIDLICGQVDQHGTSNQDNNTSYQEPHSVVRLRYLLFSLLDMIRERDYGSRESQMILICSSKENFGKDTERFDKILHLFPPNTEERQQIISKYVDDNISTESLAENTLGLSRAELAHYCRQAVTSIHSRIEEGIVPDSFLDYLKEILQSSIPESLKHGVNTDFVDIKVLSGRELQQLYPIKNPDNPTLDLPLFGEKVTTSWEDIRRHIILPLCHGSVIDEILYHHGGSSSKKIFSGGVLLASPPGTGKSTLAYFCGAVASSINHSIKVIDVSCTSLIHKEVGGSERALHRLFQIARSATPCIVVMDGIENIAAVRGNDNTTEGTMDRVLSTLLVELDGVESEKSTDHAAGSMAIIGITHNPSWIDPALRRPGRLEKTIWLDNPDLMGRKHIILKEFQDTEYKAEGYPELKTITDLATRVALDTDGYTGAELISICNETKILAFNRFFHGGDDEQKDFITPQLVFDAMKNKFCNDI